jgi:predicted PurR-regulated permease PerM
MITDKQRSTLLWCAVGVAILLVLLLLGPVLTPFAAALILSYMLLPAVDRLTRWKLPRALAVVVVILLAFALILALALIVVPIVNKETQQIRTQLPVLVAQVSDQILPKLRAWSGMALTFDKDGLRDWLSGQLAKGGKDVAAMAWDYLLSGSSALLQVVGLVFLVPVVMFYLLLDWKDLRQRLQVLIPPHWRAMSDDWVNEIDGMLSQYFRGQLSVMLWLALYYCIGLLLARFELWLPLGVLSGLLICIPYVGFAIALIFATLAGMLQFGIGYGLAACAIIYGLGQVLEGVVLTPRLVGERIGLHPLAVILALLGFGYLLGFVGVLLALPLAATLAVALRRLKISYLDSQFYTRKK